jgi:alpha-1,2-glucosyltransferase
MLQYLENERLFEDDDISISNLLKFIKLLIVRLSSLLSLSWPLLVPVSVFIFFVYKNGSVVVGDKDNHQITLHPAMPLHMLGNALLTQYCYIHSNHYNAVTCSVFISPLIASDFLNLFKSIKENKIKDILQFPSSMTMLRTIVFHGIGMLLVSLMLVYGSKSHPFLLADNRHYSFYIWRWFLSKKMIRIVIAPVYYYLIVRVISRLRQRRGPVWIMIYLVAICLSLLPASLLEFRYFTPGVMIFVLNGSLRTSSSLYVLIGIFAIINYIIITNFLERTFTWPDGSISRFMP